MAASCPRILIRALQAPGGRPWGGSTGALGQGGPGRSRAPAGSVLGAAARRGASRGRTPAAASIRRGLWQGGPSRSRSLLAAVAKPYITIPGRVEEETEVKKSRFIAIAAPVSSPEEALGFVEGASREDARHNCWAYRVGDEYRFSDDGEPGGTAGRPILAAIEGEGVDHVCVLVVRYFGGIKLGAGGLVRAYGGAASRALKEAPRVEVRPRVNLRMEVPHALLGTAYQLFSQHGAEKRGEAWSQGGVMLDLDVDAEGVEALQEAVVNQTSGQVAAVVVESLGA